MAAEILLYAVTAGCLYALLAVGYSIAYSALRFVNFAHGEVAIAAPYAFQLSISRGWPVPVAGIVAVGTSCILAVLIDQVAYRPLRNAPRIAPIVCSLGMAAILRGAYALLFGTYSINILNGPAPHFATFFGANVTVSQAAIIIVTPAMLTLAWLAVHRSRLGLAIRAVADDLPAARRSGMRVETTVAYAFAIGGALAGIAGLALATQQSFNPTTSIQIGLKAFAASVIGGIGRVPAAAAGGFLLGIVEHAAAVMFGTDARDVVTFLFLIAVLVYRPQGLFGLPEEVPKP